MLYDDFQNENSHHNCKDSVFIQNDIIIFRQNGIKTKRQKSMNLVHCGLMTDWDLIIHHLSF